jgi:DNA polymerase III epsilon subunit-like protein
MMTDREHGDRNTLEEVYISVDIETAGPVPGEYSMVSLGACLVENPSEQFYIELKPINDNFLPEALKVSGLTFEQLTATGIKPAEAMSSFQNWVQRVSGNQRAVFVGFNASFDWSFVNWYFHVFLGENPFGIGALDIKSYYMGLSGCLWQETTSSRLPPNFQPSHRQSHNALDDAIAQAEIFKKLLQAAQQRRK